MSVADNTGKSGSIQIQGASFEVLAMDTQLTFEPPMRQLAIDPSGFDFYWKLIQRVFSLPNPRAFPPLGRNSFPADDQSRASRYIMTARDLAQSTVLNSKAEAQISVSDDGKRATARRVSFPPRDTIVGFATLFRQLYSPGEKGSFVQVGQIIARANESADDSATSRRRDQLRLWTKAQSKLKGYSLESLLGTKLEDEGKWLSQYTPRSHDLNPQQLISLYLSGDLIHWGDERDNLAAFYREADLAAIRELDFLRAVAAFAHIYIGFAELVEAALSGAVVLPSNDGSAASPSG